MGYKLSLGQRFLMNARGHYTVAGSCGKDRVLVEIDPAITALLPAQSTERRLINMRVRLQAAAQQKWEAGEAYAEPLPHSREIKHHLIAITAEDLGL